MLGELLSPLLAAVRSVTSFAVRRRELPMKRLEAHMFMRGIVAEIPEFVPLHIVDSDGAYHKGVYMIGIALWNKGKLAITREDFVPGAPLQVQIDPSASLVHARHLSIEDQTSVQIEQLDPQRIQLSFDCLNPTEYVVMPMFITGNPRAEISVIGRIIGQDGPLDHTAREVQADMGERLSAAFVLLFLLNALVGAPIAAWLIHDGPGFMQFLSRPDSVPHHLSAPFAAGVFVYLMAGLAWLARLAERRKFPEGYPLMSDLEPTPWKNIQGLWNTLYKGKKQRVSASIFDWGRPVVLPEKRVKRRSIDDWVA